MPGIDGWKFIEFYNKLKLESKAEVFILSNKILEKKELDNLKKYDFIKGIYKKVLTEDLLLDLNATYFNNYRYLSLSI